MSRQLPHLAGLVLGAMMITMPANADALNDEIAPTGKLRVAIAISPAGGAFWSTKTESGGYAGVPVALGKEMAAQLGVPVEYVVHNNSGQITDAARRRAPGTSPSCRRIRSARAGCRSGRSMRSPRRPTSSSRVRR